MLTSQEILDQRERLTDFIVAEREANRRQAWSIWSLSLQERIAKGWAIDGLRVDTIETLPKGRGYLVTLLGAEDNSRFREGDAVKLTQGEPADLTTTRAEGMMLSSEEGRIVINVRRNRLHEGEAGLVLDVGLVDLSDRYLRAVEDLVALERGRRRVLPLLAGRIGPTLTPGGVNRAALQAEGFTAQQIRALEAAIGTDLCFLVQGPPGTGKTRVLARLVRLLIARKPNAAIFVTSFTHRAIEHALNAILESGVARDLVFKVGDKALDPALPHVHDADGIPAGRLSGPVVIGATPFALTTRLANVEFDWVIADEASQMTLPLAIMAMIRADRWIFFGDDRQMPPVVQSAPPREAITQSIFGRLRDNGYDIMLNETFRLPPPIAEWPSQTFYGGDLRATGDAIQRRLRLPAVPAGYERILSPEPAAVFIGTDDRSSRSFSSVEADIVGATVGCLFRIDYDLGNMGIVVPYRRQAKLIRERIRARGVPLPDATRIVVDTVERMQGQEREIVMVSLTTADVEFASLLRDFLFMPERLNVAITRPRAKLIVVGSEAWLSGFPEQITEARLFRDFLRQCTKAPCPREVYG